MKSTKNNFIKFKGWILNLDYLVGVEPLATLPTVSTNKFYVNLIFQKNASEYHSGFENLKKIQFDTYEEALECYEELQDLIFAPDLYQECLEKILLGNNEKAPGEQEVT